LLPFGVNGVAMAVTIGILGRYLLLAHLSLKLVKVSWRQFFLAQVPGCILGVAVAIPIYLTSSLAKMFIGSDMLQLLLVIVISTLSLLIGLLLLPSQWFGDSFLWLVDRLGSALPSWFRNIVSPRLSGNVVLPRIK
jgi:hypothetical protein